ncbi:MAG: hypothetical protein AB1430_17645 [Pseudomonadota bacterium]
MTLQQLTVLKRWHVVHRREAPVEYHTWDAVLTLWLMGWMGIPAALILGQVYGLMLFTGLLAAPAAYVALRRRLHASGRLRCDWLDSV